MKKKLFKIKKIFILAFLLLFLFSVDGYCETETALFLMKDETVLYSPEGYFPKAECSIEEITPFISYFAINTETSIPVSVPLTSPGTYQVFAIFEGNEKYEKYETSSTITISPVEAKIVTPYKTVAYSKMENQIPEEIKHKRFDRLKELYESRVDENNEKYLNTVQKLLIEGKSKNNKDIQLMEVAKEKDIKLTLGETPEADIEVEEQPPITAALAPYVPASGPCARRRPNSNTLSPWAAKHTLDALVAISDWKFIIVSKAVSISS